MRIRRSILTSIHLSISLWLSMISTLLISKVQMYSLYVLFCFFDTFCDFLRHSSMAFVYCFTHFCKIFPFFNAVLLYWTWEYFHFLRVLEIAEKLTQENLKRSLEGQRECIPMSNNLNYSGRLNCKDVCNILSKYELKKTWKPYFPL